MPRKIKYMPSCASHNCCCAVPRSSPLRVRRRSRVAASAMASNTGCSGRCCTPAACKRVSSASIAVGNPLLLLMWVALELWKIEIIVNEIVSECGVCSWLSSVWGLVS
jgi:hypothetical protein